MKITILSTAYPLRGGIAHFNGLLYRELIKKNEVKVVTFKRQYPAILFPGKSQTESGEASEKIPTEQLVNSVNPLNWISVGKKIKKDAPDLLIFKYWLPFFAPCFGTIARIAKNNKKTRVLVICDNVLPHEKRPGDKSFTRYFFKQADFFILLSKKVKEDLLLIRRDAKYKVISHPIYSNFGEASEKDVAKERLKIKDQNLILFFGFIRDYKGLDVLFQSLSLPEFRADIKLVVAGEFYSNREEYLKLIDELKIKSKVYLFTDFIPTSDVKYYFSACDAVILPYKEATQSGIVQIAMNFRKPVIATDVGGLGEVVLHNQTGFIVEKENPLALAEAIAKFYDENKEKEFVRNIENEVEKYSWEKFVDGISELVEE
jgi:D-inositol-3-phosphate glycosyltransferase